MVVASIKKAWLGFLYGPKAQGWSKNTNGQETLWQISGWLHYLWGPNLSCGVELKKGCVFWCFLGYKWPLWVWDIVVENHEALRSFASLDSGHIHDRKWGNSRASLLYEMQLTDPAFIGRGGCHFSPGHPGRQVEIGCGGHQESLNQVAANEAHYVTMTWQLRHPGATFWCFDGDQPFRRRYVMAHFKAKVLGMCVEAQWEVPQILRTLGLLK